MIESPYINDFTLSLVKYPLLPEQKIMLENLIQMFRSGDSDTINLARQLVINEPLLDIIVGTPTNKMNAKTLKNRVLHCKYKGTYYGRKISPYSYSYVNKEYRSISIAIEATIKYGCYWMYK